jgi:signal transduction histidine kinase
MNAPLLAGLFGAWMAVQVALGAFFLQAYFARRRELEYLLFGLVCFALAMTDFGLTITTTDRGVSHFLFASALAHTGALAATGLNVHFALAYVASDRARRFAPVVHSVNALYLLICISGFWWEPDSFRLVHWEMFGTGITQVVARPTPIAASGYAVLLLEGLSSVGLLAYSYSKGRHEVRGALLGHVVVVLAAGVDVLSISGFARAPALLPYAFLIYGFGVADTLLVRYRRAADDLEATANELRQATEELTSSYLELSVVQEELFHKRQLASVGELAASIAHEVRNPLAVIVNAAANLKRTSLVAADRDTLFGIIEEEITRLNNLVTELLRYARPMNVRREDAPVGEVLKGLAEGLAEGLDPKYTLDLTPPGADVPTIWADATLLRLALTNLVDNARQAMPDGGTITISVSRDASDGREAIRIAVNDTGQGMDSHTLHRALDPFFSTRPSGTGLGLPIAGRIVEAHGGRIEVQSRVGEGTTVSLFIPTKRPEQRSISELRREESRASDPSVLR